MAIARVATSSPQSLMSWDWRSRISGSFTANWSSVHCATLA
jgi:hypothetical protein